MLMLEALLPQLRDIQVCVSGCRIVGTCCRSGCRGSFGICWPMTSISFRFEIYFFDEGFEIYWPTRSIWPPSMYRPAVDGGWAWVQVVRRQAVRVVPGLPVCDPAVEASMAVLADLEISVDLEKTTLTNGVQSSASRPKSRS